MKPKNSDLQNIIKNQQLAAFLFYLQQLSQAKLLQLGQKEGEHFGKEVQMAHALLHEASARFEHQPDIDFGIDYLVNVAQGILERQFSQPELNAIWDKISQDFPQNDPPQHAADHGVLEPMDEANNVSRNIQKIPAAPSIDASRRQIAPPVGHEIKFKPLPKSIKTNIKAQKEQRIERRSELENHRLSSLPDKEIFINLCCDNPAYRDNGINASKRHQAQLIESSPHGLKKDIAAIERIAPNTKITVIGHCCKGSQVLSDNSGGSISATQLADSICNQLTDKATPFTINLVACQAASSYFERPSFAERLTKALADRGVYHVKVEASPTVMAIDHYGKISSISKKDDALLENIHAAQYQAKRSDQRRGFFRPARDYDNEIQQVLARGTSHYEKVSFSWNGEDVSQSSTFNLANQSRLAPSA